MSSNKRIGIDEYMEYGLDLQNRRIYFGTIENDSESTNLTAGTVQLAIRGIDKLLSISNKPIELHFASEGGDPYMMMALIDKILESPCKFIFIGRGTIMSSATGVLAVCDERLLSENTTVMLHDGRSGNYEKSTDLEISTDENIRLQKALEKIYADNSYLDSSFYQSVCRRDVYLTAQEAIKLGLADGIIPYKKRGQFRTGPRKKTFEGAPSPQELTRFVSKLFKRIKLETPKTLSIDIKKEQSEVIEEYDNSPKVIKESNEQK